MALDSLPYNLRRTAWAANNAGNLEPEEVDDANAGIFQPNKGKVL